MQVLCFPKSCCKWEEEWRKRVGSQVHTGQQAGPPRWLPCASHMGHVILTHARTHPKSDLIPWSFKITNNLQITGTINIKCTHGKVLLHTLLISLGGSSTDYWPKTQAFKSYKCGFGTQAPFLSNCATMGKSLTPSEPHFGHLLKRRLIIVITSWGHCENKIKKSA